jgi:hypothetical protein
MPIVCSLAADAAVGDRESQWRELLSRAVIRRTRAPAGVRIELRALPGVRRERERLVAAERDCCPFMTMSFETTDDQVLVLAIAAPAPRPLRSLSGCLRVSTDDSPGSADCGRDGRVGGVAPGD